MRVHTFPRQMKNGASAGARHNEGAQNGSFMHQSTQQLGTVNLKDGVVPITKAAISLAALLKRARANHEHIVLTQQGRTSGVLLDIDEYLRLRELAEQQLAALASNELAQDGPSNSTFSASANNVSTSKR